MKKQQLILAYYTLFTSIALFLWSFFFAPKPLGFILAALFTPVSLYFFLMITGVFKHQSSSSENHNKQYSKLPFIILMVLFISSVSIFVYSIVSSRKQALETNSISTVSRQLESLRREFTEQNKLAQIETNRELKKIKDQLSNMKSNQKTTEETVVMAELTSQVGTITIKDKQNQTVNVYREKNLSSEVVAKAIYGKNYTFIKKDEDWYMIILPDGKEGFIGNQFVTEVKY